MTKLDQLRLQIKEANKAYWQDNRQIMSDPAYDRLVEELRQLSPNDPLLDELGKEKPSEDKITHKKPMLSLAKFYDWRLIVNWAASVARSDDELFMVSPKYDGLSVEFLNDKISTRGDGYVGNDITHLTTHIGVIFEFQPDEKNGYIKNAMSLEDYIEHNDEIYGDDRFVGELLISHRWFDHLKHQYPDEFKDYKTCRNLVAGFANSKFDSDIANLRSGSTYTHIADLVLHRAYEIPVTLRELKAGRNVEAEIMRFINDPKIDYPVDGIVLRLADDQYAESLGVTRHHPRGSMSYKFTSESVKVEVKNIAWQVGEEHVSPIVEFDPTPLDGVLVKRATAHNAEWLEDNKIHVGSIITIERRGGVIPKVIDVEDDGQPGACPPDWCPSCGGQLRRSGKFLSCPNENCRGKIVNKITRGLEVFGIKGVGPALAEKAINLTKVSNIMEWCRAFGSRDPVRLEELSKLKFTKNELSILTRIAEVREAGVTPAQILASVCIPKCSTEFVTTIEKECGGIQNLIQIVPCDMMYNHIVGKCKMDAVTNFMVWMELHKEEFVEYMKLFKIVAPKPVTDLRGIVCFTGSGPKPRQELASLSLKSGYQCTENANQCSILVAADPNGDSGKLKKARKQGIRIIGYDEFLKML